MEKIICRYCGELDKKTELAKIHIALGYCPRTNNPTNEDYFTV